MAQLLRCDGTMEPQNDVSLAALQAPVGGYIEILELRDGRLMVTDEEGKLKQKPWNPLASLMTNGTRLPTHKGIVGDVVVVQPGEID